MYIHFSRDHILSIADFAVQQVLTVSVHCSHMQTAMLPLGPDHLESNILKITGKISVVVHSLLYVKIISSNLKILVDFLHANYFDK